ncbi:MAG: hypothetical protein A2V73_09300 [candidate division Zixibacteria bacterium RBG_19FT_COMBO_42_43]|nr:MAG: hypothetical protein A2V73_09300 [candidate division Zixibacteria bacterium RBG_19FT_COMBO_42_43]
MGKIIAFCNQKGGVGKTTSVVNLGASLALGEKKVLLVDLDPQSNATSGLGIDKKALLKTVYDVLISGLPLNEVILKTEMNCLDLVPANTNLVGAEVELISFMEREKQLSKALQPVKDEYDFIFIDSPPSLGLLTVNALVAADSVIIPIQCEYYALEGVSQLNHTIEMVQKSVNPSLKIEGVLLTMYDSRLNLSRQVQEEAQRFFGNVVYETVINRNVKLAEAPSFGKPIVLYDILSAGAENYLNLAKEILNGQSSIGEGAGSPDPEIPSGN